MFQNEIQSQKKLFSNTISLIPSENYSFYDDFKDIFDVDISGRYSFFENELFKNSFPGHKNIVEIQECITKKLKEKFNSEFLTISPLSGMNALFAVLFSFTKPGDSVFFISPKDGGHSSSKKIAERLGIKVNFIPFDSSSQKIDFEAFKDEIEEEKPGLIYIDQMTGIYPVSLLPIQNLLIKNNIISYNDTSHNGAFIVSGIHKNPLENGFNMFGGSTHKSIPGPQKAYITTNNKELFDKLLVNLNTLVSNNNPFYIAVLGKVFEKMDKYWLKYTNLILENSQYFSKRLKDLGFSILYDGVNFSQNHQVLFFGEPKINSKNLYEYLEKIGIFVNILPLPFSNGKLGIRIGVQEFSFFGGNSKDIDLIISIIGDFLVNGDKNILKHIKIVQAIKNKLILKFKEIYV